MTTFVLSAGYSLCYLLICMYFFLLFLFQVNTGEKLWIYMLDKFIHSSYVGDWYNGKREQTPEYMGNKVSMLIGMPRLRQLRIKEGELF